jgi:SDR family mycofactocin-dependent oxidoreductase
VTASTSGRLTGKVALVTGAARGQGRSHAVALAREGADVIAVDICAPVPSITGYPPAGEDDLAETVRQVEELDRRIVARVGDVRERSALAAIVDDGVATLGRLDIVVANAGVVSMAKDAGVTAFLDTLSINLAGVINTIDSAWPHLGRGASVIATGSMASMMDTGGIGATPDAPVAAAAYSESKRGVARIVHYLAIAAGRDGIRVNAVHPGNVSTSMFLNDDLFRAFRPDLAEPTQRDALEASLRMHVLPTPMLEPQDISNAVVFLASDDARYITGLQMKVDAGGVLRSSKSGAPVS